MRLSFHEPFHKEVEQDRQGRAVGRKTNLPSSPGCPSVKEEMETEAEGVKGKGEHI